MGYFLKDYCYILLNNMNVYFYNFIAQNKYKILESRHPPRQGDGERDSNAIRSETSRGAAVSIGQKRHFIEIC